MRKAILDTSFILSAIRNKIDFIERTKFVGIELILPKQVIKELKNIVKSNKKLKFRDEAEIALKILEKNDLKKIDLKKKNVDKGIIEYAKDRDIIIATVDAEIKNKTNNQKLVVRGKNKLEVIP